MSDKWDFIDTTGEQKIFKIRQVHVRCQVFKRCQNLQIEKQNGLRETTHIHTFIRNTTIQINKLPSSSEHLEMRLELQKLIKLCTCIHNTNCPFTRIYTGFFL